MRLPGYCERCHRVRQVRVARFQPGAAVQVGICATCELREEDQRRAQNPVVGQRYLAGDLPPGSVVTASGQEYVISRRGLCMRWEQPIPGSQDWRVVYAGRLPRGVWMTERERAEVEATRNKNKGEETDNASE